MQSISFSVSHTLRDLKQPSASVLSASSLDLFINTETRVSLVG